MVCSYWILARLICTLELEQLVVTKIYNNCFANCLIELTLGQVASRSADRGQAPRTEAVSSPQKPCIPCDCYSFVLSFLSHSFTSIRTYARRLALALRAHTHLTHRLFLKGATPLLQQWQLQMQETY